MFALGDYAELTRYDTNGNEIWSLRVADARTHAVAVDENEYSYVVGGGSPFVSKVSPQGVKEWQYGGLSSDTGVHAEAVAVNENGTAIYAGDENGNFHKIDEDGNKVWAFSGISSAVRAATVGPNGNVYAGTQSNKIYKISPDGNEIWNYTGHSEALNGLTSDPKHIYSASHDDSVHKINLDGSRDWNYSQHSNDVMGVAVDNNGRVYTASKDSTSHKISSDGSQIWSFNSGQSQLWGVSAETYQPSLAGSVTTPGGVPCANCTVRIVGINADKVENANELADRLNDPVPSAWDSNSDVSSGDFLDLLANTPNDENSYVAAHTPEQWQNRNLESPSIDFGSGQPIALSVWEPDWGPPHDNIDNNLQGAVRDDTEIVVKKLSPNGEILTEETIATTESKTGQWCSFVCYDEQEHEYAIASLSPGFWKVHPKGSSATSYVIKVGSISEITSELTKDLQTAEGNRTERASEVKNRLQNESLVETIVTTNADGRYTAQLNKTSSHVMVQAYKVPSDSNLSNTAGPDDIISAADNGNLNGTSSLYVTPQPKTYVIPNTDADVTVLSIDGAFGVGTNVDPGIDQTPLEFFNGTHQLKNTTDLGISAIRGLIETHQRLRTLVVGNRGSVETLCAQTPTVCIGTSEDAVVQQNLHDYNLSQAGDLNQSQIDQMRFEINAMTTALRQAPSPGGGGGGLGVPGDIPGVDTDVPEVLTEEIQLPFAIDSLEGLTVEAVYAGSDNREISDEYLTLQQGTDNGTTSAVMVQEWPVPEDGLPETFRVDFDTGQSGNVTEGVANETDRLNMTLVSEINLTNASYDVQAIYLDGTTDTIGSDYLTEKNDTAVNVTNYPIPEGKTVVTALIDVRSQTAENTTNWSSETATITRTFDTGRDISSGGTWLVKNVTAVYQDNETFVIGESYWSLKNSTAVTVSEWPMPKQGTVTGINPALVERTATEEATNITAINTLSSSFTIPNFDLSSGVNMNSVTAYLYDGSSHSVGLQYVSTSGSNDVTVSGWEIPDDGTVYSLASEVSAEASDSTSDSDGILDHSFDTGHTIVMDDPGDGELKVQSVTAVFGDGSRDRVPRDTLSTSGSTLTISGYDYPESKTVSSVEVDMINRNPAMNGNTDLSARRTVTETVDTGRDISGSGDFTVQSVVGIAADGARHGIGSSYWSVNGTSKVDVTGWPVPTGKEIHTVSVTTRVLESETNQSVSETSGPGLYNSSITTAWDLMANNVLIDAVTVTFADGTTEQVGPTNWYISPSDSSVVEIDEYPVPPNTTVTGDDVDVLIMNDSASSNVTEDPTGSNVLDHTFVVDDEIPSDAEVTVLAEYTDGARDQLPSDVVRVGARGYKVYVDNWNVPDGRTVSNLTVQVSDPSDGDYGSNVNSSEDVTNVVSETIPLSTDAAPGDVTVTANYDDGSTATLATSEWSLTDGNTAVKISDWTVPDGKTVDEMTVEVDNIEAVNSSVEQDKWLTMQVAFDDGSTLGSDISADDVAVMAHLGDGTTQLINQSYWTINDEMVQDDEIVITNWPIPEGTNVANVEVIVSDSGGADSIITTVENPEFSGSVPGFASVSVNTQYPGPSQTVQLTVTPENQAVFGNLTAVSVTDPNGNDLNVTRLGAGDRTLRFVTNGAGDHVIRLTLTNNAGNTFEETLIVNALEQSKATNAPATIRASRAVTGVYPVVSDGLTGGNIEATENQIDVTARTDQETSPPSEVEVFTSSIEGNTRGTISVDVQQGASGEDIDRQVDVNIHTSPWPSDALVYRNGEPLDDMGSINRSDTGVVIRTQTDSDGEVDVRVVQNPSVVQRAFYELDALGVDDFIPGLVVGLPDLPALPDVPTLPIGDLPAGSTAAVPMLSLGLGLAAVRQRGGRR